MARPKKPIKAAEPQAPGAQAPPAASAASTVPPPPAKPLPFRPEDPSPPDSEGAILQNVMLRQLADEIASKVELDTDSPIITAMRQFVDATRDGKPLGPVKAAIQRHATSHAQKLQVMEVLYTTRQMEIMMESLENDQHLRRFLNRCMRRGDLRPAEALVLFRYNYSQVVEITADLRKKIGHAAAENSDLATVTASVDKLDMTLKETENSIQRDFAQTTPQEREIMRKLIFRARRKLKKGEAK